MIRITEIELFHSPMSQENNIMSFYSKRCNREYHKWECFTKSKHGQVG